MVPMLLTEEVDLWRWVDNDLMDEFQLLAVDAWRPARLRETVPLASNEAVLACLMTAAV